MDNRPLFREEVLQSQRNKYFGSVSINIPMQYKVYTLVFMVLGILIFLLIIFGEWSETFIVSGYIESAKGISRIYAYKEGVILKRFVNVGQEVKQGDALFSIDTAKETLDKGNKKDVLAHLQQSKESIEKALVYKEKVLKDLKPLLDKRYIALALYHQKQDELLALERQKNSLEVAIIQQKNEQSYVIRAPIDGVMSAILSHEGQYTQQSKPLAKIIPAHTDFRAELFIPVKHAGFLSQKNKVIIRYDAYPYTRFGSSQAFIHQISNSILIDEEEDKPIRIGEPYYKVSAKLAHQYVRVYGQNKKIQQGMTVSAVIVGSKKRVWQWILDPLYSFSAGGLG